MLAVVLALRRLLVCRQLRAMCSFASSQGSVASCLQVIPHMVCFCDQDWYASILPRCRVDGSDLTLPFICPLDVLLNPAHLDASALPYRMASYLTDPQTPAKVKLSQEPVVMDTDAAWARFSAAHSNGAGAFLAAGQQAPAIVDALGDMQKVHVLNFEGLRPGAFGGFGSVVEDSRFDKVFAGIVGQDAKWCCRCAARSLSACHWHVCSMPALLHLCIAAPMHRAYVGGCVLCDAHFASSPCALFCSGEQPVDVSWITWWYQLPQPLGAGVVIPWPVPRYLEPPHCLRIRSGEAGQLNIGFLKHTNHPCTFLSQGTRLPATLDEVLASQQQLELPRPQS
jgi:hypothetical protein